MSSAGKAEYGYEPHGRTLPLVILGLRKTARNLAPHGTFGGLTSPVEAYARVGYQNLSSAITLIPVRSDQDGSQLSTGFGRQ